MGKQTSSLGKRLSRAEWFRTRRKGRKQFVWTMAAIWALVFGGSFVAHQIYKDRVNFLFDSAVVIASTAAGYFVGAKSWKHNEKEFLSASEGGNTPAPPSAS